jgi:uncharacterized protein YigE (DUF2233 family)
MIVMLGFSLLYAGKPNEEKIIFMTVDPKQQVMMMNWKGKDGNKLGSIKELIKYHQQQAKHTLFAMNGGMYTQSQEPQGLYIENFQLLAPIDTGSGGGNFYLKPNGIFYLTKHNEAHICATEDFKNGAHVKYATQSGPLLVHDGKIHAAFKNGSTNVHIRNGVGILPNKSVIFAISSTPVNLFDFAEFFQSKGCKEALYLDGFVSRMYLPEKDCYQTDGQFGVMISVVKNN